jgi:hypothetical protein
MQHPRHGQVYPIVTIDNKNEWPNVARASVVTLSVINAVTLYSALSIPILAPAISAIVCHPAFLIPSLVANYCLYYTHKLLLSGDRARVMNMYLKSNGKQVIIETQDGSSSEVNTMDLYGSTFIDHRWSTH